MTNKLSSTPFAMRAERAAAAFDIGLTTFLKWVSEGKMPEPTKIGGVALYDCGKLREAWERLQSGEEPNIFDSEIS